MELVNLHSDALLWTSLLQVPYAIAWDDVDAECDTSPLENVARQLLPDVSAKILRNMLGKPEVVCEIAGHNVQVSNSHDGGTHLAVGVRSDHITGVGVDMVYLPRIRERSPSYFCKLMTKVASPPECSRFEEWMGSENKEEICLRFAAHFSIKEAVSKAYGVGLKLGLGFGSPLSLNPREIEVHVTGSASVQPGRPYTALVTMPLKGKITAHFAASKDYLISVTLLTKE